MIRNFIITIVFITSTKAMLAQEPGLAQKSVRTYSKEISLLSENDNYMLSFHDGYYTNGMFLSYKFVSKHKPGRFSKEIIKFELGQMIFNPSSYKETELSKMDRPFAGYLYGRFSRTRFYGQNNLLELGVELGTIGKSSGGEVVQKNYHNLIGIYKVPGWTAQLHDEPGLNLHAVAAQLLSDKKGDLPFIDITTIEKIKLGNSFTNASAGLMIRFGKKQRTIETNAWGSRIERGNFSSSHQNEIFGFLQSEIIYQVYNATVQGGMFIKDKGPVTAAIMPWVYQHRLGLQFAARRFSLQVGTAFKTKEAKSMAKQERYAFISLAHRFN